MALNHRSATLACWEWGARSRLRTNFTLQRVCGKTCEQHQLAHVRLNSWPYFLTVWRSRGGHKIHEGSWSKTQRLKGVRCSFALLQGIIGWKTFESRKLQWLFRPSWSCLKVSSLPQWCWCDCIFLSLQNSCNLLQKKGKATWVLHSWPPVPSLHSCQRNKGRG